MLFCSSALSAQVEGSPFGRTIGSPSRVKITSTDISTPHQPATTDSPDTLSAQTLFEAYITAHAHPSPTNQTIPIQVIDRKGIERLGMQELYEVVRSFSGVNIKDYGGVGGLKTISIRSFGSQHTAVCYDGVTLSNAQNGQIDIGRFNLDNIGQISLSIGQADDIFQTARMFASAGALNITTTSPDFSEKSTNVSLQMRVASFGTYNPSLSYSQKLGKKWSFSLFSDWLTSNGEYPFKLVNYDTYTIKRRKNSDVNTLRAEFNLYGDFGRRGTLSFKTNYLDSERGLPGSVIYYNNDAHERLWDRNAFANLRYDRSLSEKWALKGILKYNYAWNRYLDINNRYPSGRQEDLYQQQECYASVATKYSPSEILVFTAAEDLFLNTLESTIPGSVSPIRYTSLTSFAGQLNTSRFTATASLLGTLTFEEVLIGNAAPNRSRLSPALSFSYKLLPKENLRVRASFKDIFRVPTFNDLYYARVGNTRLAPEKATQFNLGITWNGALSPLFPYASLSFDSYYNKVTDKIVALPTLFIWRMLNMGKVAIAGADLNFALEFLPKSDMSLTLSGNYSYQYAIDITNPEAKNYRHQIPYTPRHSGNLTLSWINKWLNISYLMTAVGEKYALPQNLPENRIDGYIEQSINLHRTFNLGKQRLKIQGEVLNFTNRHYEVIKYYPMPGRSYRITFKYTF